MTWASVRTDGIMTVKRDGEKRCFWCAREPRHWDSKRMRRMCLIRSREWRRYMDKRHEDREAKR